MARRLEGRRILFVVAPEQFRDEEYLEPKKVLEGEGAVTTLASTRRGTAKGMLGAVVAPRIEIREALPSDYDAVVVVGGMGSPEHLWDHAPLHRLLAEARENGKVLAAICLSGAVLGKAGVAKGKKATCWPDGNAIRALGEGGATYAREPVVVDGNLITADGPESAKRFGEAIAAALG